MTGARAGSVRHRDRVGVPVWLLVSLVLSTAITAGIAGQAAARGELSSTAGFLAGFGIATLAVAGVTSVSIRLSSRLVLLVSAAILVRFGILGGSLAGGGQFLLAWLVAAVAVLVLSDRVEASANPPLGSRGDPQPTARAAPAARSIAAVAGIVVLAALLLAPFLLPLVGDPTEPGEGASLRATEDGGSALRATDSLDMTRRPDPSDEVLFTVDSDRATFWRGETFDVWDGRRWTRSDEQFQPLLPGDRLRVGDDDLGAQGDDVVEQRVRMETAFADVVYAAASAVEVEIDRPVRQRPDGTLVSAPMGRGATYTVTSRREPLSPERLREVDGGEIPSAILDQYAEPPETTDRVREAATTVTAGATTQYDQVLALEEWMGNRVEYSLEAPLAPEGVDVVDHFLFDVEQGWCEQVASSLVVLARQNGIPARLVSGFVPGERDRLTGTFQVRGRDAHAWAEVWFPEVGWVPFDPTANVPLAGNDDSEPTVAEWLLSHIVVIVLGIALVVIVVGPVRALVRRRLAKRAARPVGWAAVADRRLDALGARVDRERRADETAEAYATALSWRYRDDRLVAVGRGLDDATYARVPPPADQQAEADAVLEQLASAPVPEPETAVPT